MGLFIQQVDNGNGFETSMTSRLWALRWGRGFDDAGINLTGIITTTRSSRGAYKKYSVGSEN